MKFLRSFGVLALVTFAAVACDDDTTGVEISALAGDWTATQFQYTDTSGRTPAPSIDAMSLPGADVDLNVEETGAFTGSILVPGLTVDGQGNTISVPLSGTISLIDDDRLSIDFDPTTEALICPTPEMCLFSDFDATFTLDGDALVFVNEDTSFDFAQVEPLLGLEPAGEVDATLTVTLVR